MLCCAGEDKALLIEAAPEIYFDTPHYQGWALVLVRMPAISAGELRHRMMAAWRLQATGPMLRRFDEQQAGEK